MGYKSEHLVEQVREVREASGLSQRALSAKTGQTQSHISQIESGKMEPGLSSFIDMARALDLEVMLVPKKLVPGVRGVIRSQATPDMHIHAGQPNDKRFARAVRLLKRFKETRGSSADADRLEDSLLFLRRVRLGDQEMQLVREQLDRLEHYEDTPHTHEIVQEVGQILRQLRNSIAHGKPSEPQPAYALGDGDDDA